MKTWKPTRDQRHALTAIQDWRDGDGTEFVLRGLAGTGKTELCAHLPAELGLKDSRVLFVAPTNKAAHNVLRGKLRRAGCSSPTRTVHSYRYHPPRALHCDACPHRQRRKDACHVAGKRKPSCYCGQLVFTVKPVGDMFDLIICDESSMLTKQLYLDLLEAEVPILFVGDHGQLGPVGDDFSVLERDLPHYELKEICRQVKESPIIWAAYEARNGRRIPAGEHGPHGEVTVDRGAEIDPRNAEAVMVTFKNTTVRKYNVQARDVLGFTEELCVGDRLICDTNIQRDQVFRGMTGVVTKASRLRDGNYMVTLKLDGDGRPWTGLVFAARLAWYGDNAPEVPQGMSAWQYAYCMTVNKAQGSEWRQVTVIDDYHPQARLTPQSLSYRRWLYTAITRASEALTIVRT